MTLRLCFVLELHVSCGVSYRDSLSLRFTVDAALRVSTAVMTIMYILV